MRNDVRYTLRGLRRAPVFAAVAILSVALGIGANTAMFSLMDQLLFRDLNVERPETLVTFHAEGDVEGRSTSDNHETVFSYPVYKELRDRATVMKGVFARASASANVLYRDSSERAGLEWVSGNYFTTLGVKPALGRLFTSEDDRNEGAHPLAVLSFKYWQNRFGSDPGVLNTTVWINNVSMTVIGVAPRDFYSVLRSSHPDLYMPLTMRPRITPNWKTNDDRKLHWLNLFGRLNPEVSVQQAEAAMATIFRPILEFELTLPNMPNSKRFREEFTNKRLELRPAAQGINDLRDRWRTPVIALMSMVGLVLLIACANVAGLLLARATARRREIAVRLAIGAGRMQIVSQLMIESITLAVLGGGLGLLLSSWIMDALLRLLPVDSFRTVISGGIDFRLFLFSLGLSLITGLAFGVVPAIQISRPDLLPALKDQRVSSKGDNRPSRFRRGLVTAQVALSLILLVASGLFARSLYNILKFDPGFRTEHLLSFALDPATIGYDHDRAAHFYRTLVDRFRSMPGIVSVGAANLAPLSGENRSSNVTVEGYAATEDEYVGAAVNRVSSGYFRTMRINLLSGREFNERDVANSPKVGVVNEAFVKKYFSNRQPLSKKFRFGSGNGVLDVEIVGIVANSKHGDLRENVGPFVYIPYEQSEQAEVLHFFLRMSGSNSAGLPGLVRQVVRGLDVKMPVFAMKTMQVQIEENAYRERLTAILSIAFGVLATLLAAIGLYGVIAFSVSRRTSEIGIRMALGAQRGSVLWLVMREVALVASIGVTIGMAVATALARTVESQLFGMKANDPLTFGLAACALLFVTAMAGYLPAARASRINPTRALRYE